MKSPLTALPPIIVLAGGLGTRLRSVVADRPKVLAPIKEQPYLKWLLDWLTAEKVTHVHLALGYKGEMVERWLAEHQTSHDWPRLTTSIEPAPLGTGGAMAYAMRHFDDTGTDELLAMNGDTFLDISFDRFIRTWRASSASLAIAAVHVPDASRYGMLTMDTDNRVITFQEKSTHVQAGYINGGIYGLSGDVLKQLRQMDHGSMEKDIFQSLPPRSILADTHGTRFIDIGTPESYAQVADFMEKKRYP